MIFLIFFGDRLMVLALAMPSFIPFTGAVWRTNFCALDVAREPMAAARFSLFKQFGQWRARKRTNGSFLVVCLNLKIAFFSVDKKFY